MTQVAATAVRSGVIAFSTPNHPLRLTGILAASFAFFAIVAAAAGALAYVIQDMRAAHRTSAVLGTDAVPKQSELNLPSGVIALQHAADENEFKQFAGFEPFIPKQLPEHTKDDLSLSVALPDDNGVRAGRVGYSDGGVAGPDGITGPVVVLWETKGTPDASAVGAFRPVPGNTGRVLVATVGCGGLVLKMELYFHPNPAPGEPAITPYMTDTARSFLDGLKRQCG